MSVKEEYKTVSHEGSTVFIDRKSRFISHVMPVSSEAAAIEYLNKIRSEYPDARHNVYAYVIDENNIFRYSDDGEPSGTAGMPVLDTIRKSGLVDVIVVVTRYFGGTLLGTGGLVHAYGTSATEGLKAAGIVTRSLCDIVDARVNYSMLGSVQHKLMTDGYMLEDTIYGEDVTFRICSPIHTTAALIAELTDLTNGTAVCETTDKKYVDKEEEH